MLRLKEIQKNYLSGDSEVHALRGVNLCFRKSEFVSILGPSGCGKTTMLNIIGGLDRYTSGDLFISGRSTKQFTNKDWDNYRNHKIGFVFQTYNLINHQSVLSNVELALTLSGVGKAERRKRAVEALERVGLKDQIKKKPNQLSGGQMQRVAIARALVNDPDIILADEPTGALDTVTSVQILDLLREISGNKLIIMVTHNSELADKYSDRIINLVDGQVTGDSHPLSVQEWEAQMTPDEIEKEAAESKKRVSMSFLTALSLSFNNLLTKKARTILTSFAGSIGIIGIALVLALSNGIQLYIESVQRDTLASYPLNISSETFDYSEFLTSMDGNTDETVEHEDGKIYSNTMIMKMLSAFTSQVKKNNLSEFKKYIESGVLNDYVTAVSYGYDASMKIYSYNASSAVATAPEGNQLVYPSTIVSDMMNAMGGSVSGDMSEMATQMYQLEPWAEIMSGNNGEIINPLIEEQYELVGANSRFPQNKNEIVIVASKNDMISDLALYSMGIKDSSEMENIIQSMLSGDSSEIDTSSVEFDYEQLLSLRFRVVLPCDEYNDNGDGTWSLNEDTYSLVENGLELKVVGVIKPKENTSSAAINGVIAYTSSLTQYIIDECMNSAVMKAQLSDKETDVTTGGAFTGKTYGKDNVVELLSVLDETSLNYMMSAINEQLAPLGQTISTVEELAAFMSNNMSDDAINQMANQLLPGERTTYESNLERLGYCDINTPSSISIYAKTFDDKEVISGFIDSYNKDAEKAGKDENVIRYTDYVALIMSSVSDIVRFVSYGCMAFVSVSLIVSSIMIGIITYVSVLERTKEIGILRAIGASKRNIRSVFNAETTIIGFTSGAIGIIATLLLCLPVNLILHHLTDITGIATLPVDGAIFLVILSVILTLVAGVIPALIAANKDPVTALRSE